MTATRKIPDKLKNKVLNLDNQFAHGSQALDSFCSQLAISPEFLETLLADQYFLNFIKNNPNPDLFESSLSHLFYQLDNSLITYENVMKILLVSQLSREAHSINPNIELNFEYKQGSHFALRIPGQAPLNDKKKLDDALDAQWNDIKRSIPNLPAKIPNHPEVLNMLRDRNFPKQTSRNNEVERPHNHSSTHAIQNGIRNVKPYQPHQPPVKAESIRRQDVLESNVRNAKHSHAEILIYNDRNKKEEVGYVFKQERDSNRVIRSNVRHMTTASEKGPSHAAHITSYGTLKSGGHFSCGAEKILVWDQDLKKTAEINIPKSRVIMSAVELDNGWLACCDRIGRLYIVDPKKPTKVYEYDDGQPKFIEGKNPLTKLRLENGKLIQSSDTRRKEFDLDTIMADKKLYNERPETQVRQDETNQNRYRR